jgi:hypothetical protein
MQMEKESILFMCRAWVGFVAGIAERRSILQTVVQENTMNEKYVVS